jgi:IS1 family transposase
MNQLTTKERAQILAILCEGVGINAATRITSASKNTALKLLADAGEACAIYQDENHKNLNLTQMECEEFGIGDVYTWTAIDADTKLVPCWHVGTRDAESAKFFINDLAKRLNNIVQLTTDGHKAYLQAIEDAFGADVDYAMLIKFYGNGGNQKDDTRCSLAECTGIEKKHIEGAPQYDLISTSYVERQNLTMRMHMRRFTRLTNAFSKKLENHMHALSLYFMFYNYCKIHKSLRISPAMAAGLTDHVWELTDIVNLIPDAEPKKRCPYKKKNSN